MIFFSKLIKDTNIKYMPYTADFFFVAVVVYNENSSFFNVSHSKKNLIKTFIDIVNK